MMTDPATSTPPEQGFRPRKPRYALPTNRLHLFYGMVTGPLVAFIYTTGILIYAVIGMAGDQWDASRELWQNLGNAATIAAVAAVWVYAVALLIGMLPSAVLGLAFAFCIDGLIRAMYSPGARIKAAILGAGVPLLLCGAAYLPRVAEPDYTSGSAVGFSMLIWASQPISLILMAIAGAALGLIIQNRFDRFTSITTPESANNHS